MYEFAKYTNELVEYSPAALRGAEAPDAKDEQVAEYAGYLGIDLVEEPELVWIAAKCMAAPLPKGWEEYTNEQGEPYFHNKTKDETSWDHPLDSAFRSRKDPQTPALTRKFPESIPCVCVFVSVWGSRIELGVAPFSAGERAGQPPPPPRRAEDTGCPARQGGAPAGRRRDGGSARRGRGGGGGGGGGG